MAQKVAEAREIPFLVDAETAVLDAAGNRIGSLYPGETYLARDTSGPLVTIDGPDGTDAFVMASAVRVVAGTATPDFSVTESAAPATPAATVEPRSTPATPAASVEPRPTPATPAAAPSTPHAAADEASTDGAARNWRPLLIVAIVALIAAGVVALVLAFTGGDTSDPVAEATTAAFAIDDADPEIVAIADSAIERFGEEEGFAAVMFALERGYSVDQLAAATASNALAADGTIAGVEPAASQAGVFTLPDSPPSSSTTTSPPTPPPPTAVPQATTVPAEDSVYPSRIVSFSPTVTELLFALGSGDLVVAADARSTAPPEAPAGALDPALPTEDAVAPFDPDLVILPGLDPAVNAGLDAADYEFVIMPLPTTLDEGLELVEELGVLVGREPEAAALAQAIAEDIERAMALAPDASGLTIYHEYNVGPTAPYFAVTSGSFIASIYEQMGAVTVGNDLDEFELGFARIDDAAVIAANPDVIVIDALVRGEPFDIDARPGWSQLDALRTGQFISYNGEYGRFGPRTADLIEHIAGLLAQAAGEN